MTPATCGRPWATGRSSTASTRPRGLAAGGWGELESAWDATRFEAAMEADPGSEERTRLVSDLVGTFFRSYSVQAEGQREAYLSGQELGEDVLVRLAGRKLYAIDSWQIVKELFQAQT